METLKVNILDMFFKHVDESDWLEGLDLYQAGKVDKLCDYSGLITAKVVSHLSSSAEVRLKIHPSGQRIQWIECTCPKYRRTGRYCEHMAAFMINIDRERPQLLGNLDSKMPLKPPSPKKRSSHAQEEKKGLTRTLAKLDDAAQTILTHLKGNIHSVSLLAKGPNMRVRLEIKPGALTHYNLDLDSAAKFLSTHQNIKNATDEVKQLKVYSGAAMRGSRVFQETDETIVVERVITIRHTARTIKKTSDDSSKSQTVIGHYKHIADNIPGDKVGFFEFLPLRAGAKYVGREYIFIPERGYWPILKDSTKGSWTDLPLRRTFTGDKAAQLIASGYAEYREAGPLWLEEHLDVPIIDESLSIANIAIHKSDGGWFFLDPKYQSGSTSISMVELLNHFTKSKRNYLKSGKAWIRIPDFVKENEWTTDESGKYLKVNSIGLMRLRAQIGDFDGFVGSKKLLNELRSKVEFSELQTLPSLEASNLDLREYQQKGYEWLWWLYQNGLHGLLADEMGLGKTHQAMAIMTGIQNTESASKFLVICPTTVIDHWYNKIQDFCPALNPVRHHGSKRSRQNLAGSSQYHTIITSYGVLLRDISSLQQLHFAAIILDEAHYIKNNVTSTYRAACQLNGDFRLCLTGTPMENHIGELKNIFDFLMPGYLGSERYFKKNFLAPIENNEGFESELALQKMIHPFKMRRTKGVVLKDLPEKVEDYRKCELSKEQTKLYKNILSIQAKPLVDKLEKSESPVPYLHVFHTLTLLKQICNHPALVAKSSDYQKFESGKFDSFKEIVSEALDSGHKIVIYSQYLGMIDIFHRYFSDLGVDHVTLTGSTTNRGTIIDRFQTDQNCKVFCGSLMAGGIGIDLTAASVVIHYDRWWNASKENQATDRVHRIGQQKNVQVFKMITKGTLEEKIDKLILSKQATFEKFLDRDEEMFKKLTRQELIDLLT